MKNYTWEYTTGPLRSIKSKRVDSIKLYRLEIEYMFIEVFYYGDSDFRYLSLRVNGKAKVQLTNMHS